MADSEDLLETPLAGLHRVTLHPGLAGSLDRLRPLVLQPPAA